MIIQQFIDKFYDCEMVTKVNIMIVFFIKHLTLANVTRG
jgi:hypothetical protein